jgi:hypothetical protein
MVEIHYGYHTDNDEDDYNMDNVWYAPPSPPPVWRPAVIAPAPVTPPSSPPSSSSPPIRYWIAPDEDIDSFVL